MVIPEYFKTWQELYKQEVKTAEKELAEKKFNCSTKSVIGDIYVLPCSNHQTFYGKFIKESLLKMAFVKPLQNSVWFSEPIYHYCITDAKRFENHPMRKGRLICHADFIDIHFVEEISRVIELLAEEQPDYAVSPDKDAVFTAIRFFSNGIPTGKVCFTDPDRLVFKNGRYNPAAVQFLREIHTELEKVVGLGE